MHIAVWAICMAMLPILAVSNKCLSNSGDLPSA